MDRSSGLRFDIFERVHLSEENEEIARLEEIELVPQIELNVKDTQAVLSGHLQLSGKYGNMRSEEQHELEHRIPVEITLPLDRIRNADNIDIEIENFDVEMISARTLNVTGVLSLSGLELNREPQVNWANEEAVFVHDNKEEKQAQSAAAPEVSLPKQTAEAFSIESSAEDERSFESRSEAKSAAGKEASGKSEQEAAEANAAEPLVEFSSADWDRKEAAEAAANSDQVNASEENAEGRDELAAEHDSDHIVDEELPVEHEQEAEVEVEEEAEAKEEVKIAFSKQKDDESNAFSKKLTSLLSRPDELSGSIEGQTSMEAAEQSADQASQLVSDAEREEDTTAGSENGLEWKKLFLSQDEEEANRFSRLKMCIVQKDETLETIADRYELNPREILLYNRMGDQSSLSEGQVIYIPQLQK